MWARPGLHLLRVELEVDDRPVQVGRVERHRRVVGDQDRGAGEQFRWMLLADEAQRRHVLGELDALQRRPAGWGAAGTATFSPCAAARSRSSSRADDLEPVAGEVGLRGSPRGPREGGLRPRDQRRQQPVPPGRGDQDEVPVRRAQGWRPEGGEAVEARQAGQLDLAARQDVAGVVTHEGLELLGGARDHRRGRSLLAVEPVRQVVLDHAVLQEGEPPPDRPADTSSAVICRRAGSPSRRRARRSGALQLSMSSSSASTRERRAGPPRRPEA